MAPSVPLTAPDGRIGHRQEAALRKDKGHPQVSKEFRRLFRFKPVLQKPLIAVDFHAKAEVCHGDLSWSRSFQCNLLCHH